MAALFNQFFKNLQSLEGVSAMKKLNKAFNFLELCQNITKKGGT
jgi:hypothetical protein